MNAVLGTLPNDKSVGCLPQKDLSCFNQKEQSYLGKQYDTKQNHSRISDPNFPPNINSKNRTSENEEQKNLYSTFAGSTNFAKELKNSPLKKTHYNLGEINSKYVAAKEKNAVNFTNLEVFWDLAD